MRQRGLIGRSAELGHIASALDGARSGRGGAIVILGEPGIGTTRLATEAVSLAADAGMITGRGQAGASGPTVPYAPLVDALVGLAGADAIPDLDELGPYRPVLARLCSDPRDAGSPSPILVGEAVLRLLAVAGRHRGCLLVLDDLHDADLATLTVVEYLLDNLTDQPAVLLLTARREPRAAADLAARARQRGAAAILEPRPLGRPDVRRLVAAELGVEPGAVNTGPLDRILAASAGVPAAIRDLVDDLTEQDRDILGLPPDPVADGVTRCRGRGDDAVEALHEAGVRALADGRVERAVVLLNRARRLTDSTVPPDRRAAVLDALLRAVARAARFDLVPALAADLDAARDLPAARRAGLYARLATVDTLAGLPGVAVGHLDVARRLLGDSPTDSDAAPVDAAAAWVEPGRLAPDRLRTATDLAGRAAGAAQRAGLPSVAAEALLAFGRLARERDGSAAVARLTEARAIAVEHRLPELRVTADAYLAGIAATRDGEPGAIDQVRRDALGVGALPLADELGHDLALEEIRRCEFDAAGHRIRAGLAGATRLRLGRTLAMLRLADAVRYAHQGRRAEMRDALARLDPVVDDAPGIRPMSYGLARAFCSLLEEDRDAAERDLAQALAYDAENPATGEFGRYGIIPLLGVLAGRMGWQHLAEVDAAGAAGTRWNRAFGGLARAVLLGRDGDTGAASAAATDALAAAEPYPMARGLGLRLVAWSAYQDRWGDPVAWSRDAEEYFHGAGITAVAAACRGQLREMGAPVRQRRTGTERVPPDLRRAGVTVREFEVARLLALRLSDKDIAGRLHISPRTVEKHVASLLQKTGHSARSAFVATRDRFDRDGD